MTIAALVASMHMSHDMAHEMGHGGMDMQAMVQDAHPLLDQPRDGDVRVHSHRVRWRRRLLARLQPRMGHTKGCSGFARQRPSPYFYVSSRPQALAGQSRLRLNARRFAPIASIGHEDFVGQIALAASRAASMSPLCWCGVVAAHPACDQHAVSHTHLAIMQMPSFGWCENRRQTERQSDRLRSTIRGDMGKVAS